MVSTRIQEKPAASLSSTLLHIGEFFRSQEVRGGYRNRPEHAIQCRWIGPFKGKSLFHLDDRRMLEAFETSGIQLVKIGLLRMGILDDGGENTIN
jgi:hypothetical protein